MKLLCLTVMVGKHHHIFVQTHRIYNTKSDPSCNCEFQIIVLYQYWFINCKKFITLRQYVNNKKIVYMLLCVCVCVCNIQELSVQLFYKLKTALRNAMYLF